MRFATRPAKGARTWVRESCWPAIATSARTWASEASATCSATCGREVVLVGDAAGLQEVVRALLLGERVGAVGLGHGQRRPRAVVGEAVVGVVEDGEDVALRRRARPPSRSTRRRRAGTSATTWTWARGLSVPVRTTSSAGPASRRRRCGRRGRAGPRRVVGVAAAEQAARQAGEERRGAAGIESSSRASVSIPAGGVVGVTGVGRRRSVVVRRRWWRWRGSARGPSPAGPGPSRSAARRARSRARAAPPRG